MAACGAHDKTEGVEVAHRMLPMLLTFGEPKKADGIFRVRREHTRIDEHAAIPSIMVGGKRIGVQGAYAEPVPLRVIHGHPQLSLDRSMVGVLHINGNPCRGNKLRGILLRHLDAPYMGQCTIVLDVFLPSARTDTYDGVLHVVESTAIIGNDLKIEISIELATPAPIDVKASLIIHATTHEGMPRRGPLGRAL